MNSMKRTYLLNSCAGLLTSFQATIILIIMARFSSLEDSGIFTFAYATASLFLSIGVYGMNTFQISDVKDDISFENYVFFRGITCLIMFAVATSYVVFQFFISNYSLKKGLVILIVSLWKMMDAIGYVFYARLQKLEKLDYAAISIILRRIGSIVGFCTVIVLSKNLIYATLVAFCISAGVLCGTLFYLKAYIFPWRKKELQYTKINHLFHVGTPLFIHAFLSLFITSIPKYAIDNFAGDEIQAVYGYIAMPVFIIELLNGFIVQPMLVPMSTEWQQNNKRVFRTRIKRQLYIIAGITFSAIIVAYFIGIPILELVFQYDLNIYKLEFILLLLSGGFLAVAGYVTTVLTIIRKQTLIMNTYIIGSMIAYLGTNILVKEYGIRGASVGNVLVIGGLSIILLIMCLKKTK